MCVVTETTKVPEITEGSYNESEENIFVLTNLPSHYQTLGGRTQATHSHCGGSKHLPAIPCTFLALKIKVHYSEIEGKKLIS